MTDKLKKIMPYLIILLSSITISIALFTLNLSTYNEARIHIMRIASIKESDAKLKRKNDTFKKDNVQTRKKTPQEIREEMLKKLKEN